MEAPSLAVRRAGSAGCRLSTAAIDGEPAVQVVEPTLSPSELDLLRELERSLTVLVAPRRVPEEAGPPPDAFFREIRAYLDLHRPGLPASSRDRLEYYLARNALGYGPIDALVNDPETEDVSCDGVGLPVYVVRAREGSLPTNVRFEDEATLDAYVRRLGQRCGGTLSGARPLVDGTTPEGHRVQATYGRDVSSRGASFTLRRRRTSPFTPLDLGRSGAASWEMLAYLWLGAELGDSSIVAGGPGTGKSSTLNAIAMFLPARSKIVSLEETRELDLPHENWVAATTRSGSGPRGADGRRAGEIDLFDLVRAALRQRPTHILVGEVRGREAFALFQAMASGHTACSTVHADGVRSLVARLENPPISVPRALLGSLRAIVIEEKVERASGPVRRIREIDEVVRLDPETNELLTNRVFQWDAGADRFDYLGHSDLYERAGRYFGGSAERVRAEIDRRAAYLERLSGETLPGPSALMERLEAAAGAPREGGS